MLKKAERKQVKLKIGLGGTAGSGKTYSALKLAYGMCQDWSKICVIDTENKSASLYSDLGGYYTIELQAPFTPERYVEAIKECEKEGIEVIIIDSISHEWAGAGGILNIHSGMAGNNSFNNWGKVKPRHNILIEKVLQSPCHIIGTIRTKIDYSMEEVDGKFKIEKVGTKLITSDDIEYEFTIFFDLDTKHNCRASKDRTGLFIDKPEFIIDEETGKKIIEWNNSGKSINQIQDENYFTFIQKIEECGSVEELQQLWKTYSSYDIAESMKTKVVELKDKKKADLLNNR